MTSPCNTHGKTLGIGGFTRAQAMSPPPRQFFRSFMRLTLPRLDTSFKLF